jgi:hypothetical protein
MKAQDSKAQLPVRTEQWILEAIQDDAKRAGLDPLQLNTVLNRALKLYVSERGYTEPECITAQDFDAVSAEVTQLCRNDQSAAIKLLQTITEALSGAAKVGAVLIC